MLHIVGLKGPKAGWLGDQNIVIYSIAMALIWQAVGYYMVMYMAGMANIPDSLYEAAVALLLRYPAICRVRADKRAAEPAFSRNGVAAERSGANCSGDTSELSA